MLTFIALLAIALYVGGTALLCTSMTRRQASLQTTGLAVAGIAVIGHLIVLLGMHGGHIDLHFYAALSLVSWVVALLTLLVNTRRPVAALGVIVFPIAAILLAIDMFAAPATTPHPMDWHLSLHVAIALLAYSVLSIGAVLAILLAVQEHALRHHKPTSWLRVLPPLTQTETLLFQLLGTGFVLLTLTLVSGAVFVHDIIAQHVAHIIVLSVAAWIIFGALLWGRWRYGWRGRRAVNMTLVGMAVLALGFFGSKFVLELILQRTA